MRNIKNIRRLADFIENARYEFDMSDGEARPKCGSAGCIGGHAAMLWPSIRIKESRTTFSWDEGGLSEKLGISVDEQFDLCYLRSSFISLFDVDRQMAVRALRRLAATGRVQFKESDRAKAKR